MYKLKDTGITPPCGWVYHIPETKMDLKADSYKELIAKATSMYEINGRTVPGDLEFLIQVHICKLSPTGICVDFMNRFAYTARTLMNGTNAFAALMRQGKGGFVSQEVAEERAEICSSCPLNYENPGCYTCKGFEHIVKGVLRGRSSKLDGTLKVCGICGCFIRALIHVDVKILRLATRPRDIKKYPEMCWKRKELEN